MPGSKDFILEIYPRGSPSRRQQIPPDEGIRCQTSARQPGSGERTSRHPRTSMKAPLGSPRLQAWTTLVDHDSHRQSSYCKTETAFRKESEKVILFSLRTRKNSVRSPCQMQIASSRNAYSYQRDIARPVPWRLCPR